MTRLSLQIAVGATALNVAASTPSAETINGVSTCGEYFDKGGFCLLYTSKKPLATTCTQTPPSCSRAQCCDNQAYTGSAGGTGNTCANTWKSPAVCPSAYEQAGATGTLCGKFSQPLLASSEHGKDTTPCTQRDCCVKLGTTITCETWYDASHMCLSSQSIQGDNYICAGTTCTEQECCYKPPRNCNSGFFDIGKICGSKYEVAKLNPHATTCSLYDCTDLDCCKEKVGIGKCSTWFGAGNVCGKVDAALKFRKPSTANPRCITTACTEADCCEAAATCDGFTGCVGTKAITRITTTCKLSTCTSKECCVDRTICSSWKCPPGQTLTTGAATLKCTDGKCTTAECCIAVGKSKVATCAAFTDEDCTGKDSKDRKYTTSLGKLQTCGASGCSKATCCAVEEDATCFPGEAEVSVADGSLMTLAEIEPSMEVLAEANMEPVIGMLHLHSEAHSIVVHPTSTSA